MYLTFARHEAEKVTDIIENDDGLEICLELDIPNRAKS